MSCCTKLANPRLGAQQQAEMFAPGFLRRPRHEFATNGDRQNTTRLDKSAFINFHWAKYGIRITAQTPNELSQGMDGRYGDIPWRRERR